MEKGLLEPAAGDLDVTRLGIRGKQRANRAVRVGAVQDHGLTAPFDVRDARETASSSRSAPGSVTRIVRRPTMALISFVGPSATTRPFAMRIARSAYRS